MLLTRWSCWLVLTLVMRSSGHKPLGGCSSVSSTISPIWKFRRGLNHFCLSCKVGRYSFTHLRQNTSDKYWTCLHLCLEYMSSLAKIPGGNGWLYWKRRRWLGVRGSRLRTSSETFVKGLLFTIDYAWHMNVDSLSSSSTCSLTSVFKTCLTVLMQCSHGPPWWDPHGGLNAHWMFLWRRKSAIFSWFHSLIEGSSSRSPDTKLPPLSDLISYCSSGRSNKKLASGEIYIFRFYSCDKKFIKVNVKPTLYCSLL